MDMRLLLGVARVAGSGLRLLGRHRAASVVAFVLALGWLALYLAPGANATPGGPVGVVQPDVGPILGAVELRPGDLTWGDLVAVTCAFGIVGVGVVLGCYVFIARSGDRRLLDGDAVRGDWHVGRLGLGGLGVGPAGRGEHGSTDHGLGA